MIAKEQDEVDAGPSEPIIERSEDSIPPSKAASVISTGDYCIFAILVGTNLLNYADRYTICGVLESVQLYYATDDSATGAIATAFILAYSLASPVAGYLGDRYHRVRLMAGGIALWQCALIASTFIPHDRFIMFVVARSFIGVGMAFYSVIAPSYIADIFGAGARRSMMLMIFYLAIPFGGGIGFMVAGGVSSATGGVWQWGIRVTAIGGVICLIIVLLFVDEKQRGALEVTVSPIESCSYWKDLRALALNGTFVCAMLANAVETFTSGSMAFWTPTAYMHTEAWKIGLNTTEALDPKVMSSISVICGMAFIVGGLIGVVVGWTASSFLKSGTGCCRGCKCERADPIVSALGNLIALPTLFGAIYLLDKATGTALVCFFIFTAGVSVSFATTLDLIMTVVIPARRSTAVAVSTMMMHMLGGAPGPVVVGAISDAIRRGRFNDERSPEASGQSLLTSFYVAGATLLLSILLYFGAAMTFPRDRLQYDEDSGSLKPSPQERVGPGSADEN